MGRWNQPRWLSRKPPPIEALRRVTIWTIGRTPGEGLLFEGVMIPDAGFFLLWLRAFNPLENDKERRWNCPIRVIWLRKLTTLPPSATPEKLLTQPGKATEKKSRLLSPQGRITITKFRNLKTRKMRNQLRRRFERGNSL